MINAGGSFLYYNNMDVKSDANGSDNLEHYGAVFDIQPEYRFTPWFGLGIDVEIGGFKTHTPNILNKKGHFYFQSYVTGKFIWRLNAFDLWGEIDLGPGAESGDYIDMAHVEHGTTWTLLGRLKLGATYKFNEKNGVGIHFGVASGIPAPCVVVTTGIHYTFFM